MQKSKFQKMFHYVRFLQSGKWFVMLQKLSHVHNKYMVYGVAL